MARAIELVREVFDAQPPANVDRAAVTLTGEGELVGIVLIPHRDLGGYSLILWVDSQHMALGWGAVIDLSRHEDIDMAKWVFQTDSVPALTSALSAELERPVRVQLRRTRVLGRWQVRCENAMVRYVAQPSERSGERSIEVGTTSLMGAGSLARRWPVPLTEWR